VIQPKIEELLDIHVVLQKPQQEIHHLGPEHAISSMGVMCESVVKTRYFGVVGDHKSD
jgi:hypothetical protein